MAALKAPENSHVIEIHEVLKYLHQRQEKLSTICIDQSIS